MPSKHKNLDKIPEKPNGRDWKASSRHGSAGSAVSGNAYNPYSGTFHAVAADPGMANHHSRFKNADDGEDNASSIGASAEYDSISNNESCSGESEDQSQAVPKEKHGTSGSGSPPGSIPGSEKRDKTRWKNEKKHQRQKERRAKDLKDRSTGYLMSRKLEVLAEQLLSMGFSLDRATMALILNEGHVERSVAWLLEGGDEQVKEGWKFNGDLKIDISEELARIAELEIVYKYPRAEVERAIVACQGNVDKVTEWLRDHYPILPEFSANIVKANAAQQESSVSRQANCLLIESSSMQHQLEETRCNASTFHGVIPHRSGEMETIGIQSKLKLNGHFPARKFEVTSGAGPLVQSSGVVTGKLKVSPKSNGRVVNTSMQMLHSVPRVTRSIPNCVSPIANIRSSSQIKNVAESKQCQTKTLDVTSQPSFEHASLASADSGHFLGCSIPHPPVTTDSPVADLKNDKNTFSSVLSTTPKLEELSSGDLNGAIATNFPALDFPSSNPGVVLKTEESLKKSNNMRSTLAISETACSAKTWDFSVPNSSKSMPFSSEFLTGWAFGAPGEYAGWSMAAIGGCDYRTIDWSMQPSPPNSSETGSWGMYKGFATTSNLPDESQQVQDLSTDLISSFQNASLCSGFPRNLSNTFDIWADAKLRGHSKTLGTEELDSAHCTSLGMWTSPFDEKDLFTLSLRAVSSPSL